MIISTSATVGELLLGTLVACVVGWLVSSLIDWDKLQNKFDEEN